MTLIPNYLVTGILAIAMGLAVAAWTAKSVGRRNGGLILVGLSVLMVLDGGGLMPLVPGIVAGALWHLTGHTKPAVPFRHHHRNKVKSTGTEGFEVSQFRLFF